MYCINCGKQIPDGSKFCVNCGSSQDSNQATPSQQQPAYNNAPRPFNQPYPNQNFPGPSQPYAQPPKKKGKAGAVIAVLLVLAVIVAAGFIWGDDLIALLKPGTTPGNTVNIGFEEASVTVEATGTVTSAGGTIALPSGSELAGSSVMFPGATVDQDVAVSVGTVKGTYTNAPESISDTALYIDIGGYTDLAQPIEITFKYADTAEEAERVPSGLYIDAQGNLIPVITKCIDKKAGTFTILTFHASTYTYYLLDEISSYPDSSTTGFLPSVDGFSEENTGSSVFTRGECYGMSTFAKWYYLNKKSGNNGFAELFKSPQMGVSPTGDIIIPQDVIATKAFQYTTRESSILWDTERHFSSYVEKDDQGNILSYTTDNSVSVRCIMDALYFFEEPVEVGIYGSAGHSVLAYGYTKTASKVTIKIYDPNFPLKNDQVIVYDIATKTISTPAYTAGFLDSRLTTTGYGTFNSVADYEKILEDANNNFAGSIANLVISDPVNGATVDSGTYYISGTLDTLTQMGEQLGDLVEIVNEDGMTYRQSLTKNGTAASYFSTEVPLKNGENKFLINIIYSDENGNEHYMTHNFYGWLVINSTIPMNAIYITLTWDGQPDIDLYVTDPNGETSYFENYTTSDGGWLDMDDTSSYGPEHWTLTTSSTVRWGQAYTVRLHYYYGSGPTSYNVTVTSNEGTDYETTSYYSGVIGYSDYEDNDTCDNYLPGGGGGDWVDICTVIPYMDEN
ncbi:MAG: zinc-ribbon domain-containing protein [Clostridia bacterium]